MICNTRRTGQGATTKVDTIVGQSEITKLSGQTSKTSSKAEKECLPETSK